LLTTAAGIAVGSVVVLVSLAGAASDPTGGPLAVPFGDGPVPSPAAGLALGLVGALLPAALIGRAPLTALADARQ
jgi:putative ABC transport system permease protein